MTMSRLAGTIDGVIGVDTHRDTLAAAVTDPVGGVLAQLSVSADAAGYQRLIGLPERRCQDAAAGRWRVPAATAPAWQPSCRPMASAWWRSPGPSGRRGAVAPRATPWTPCEQLVRRWPASIPLDHVVVGIARRCRCCWPPAPAPVGPRSAPPPAQGVDRRGAGGAAG